MRLSGFIMIALSATVLCIDRVTHLITNSLGRWCCGEDYLQPVEGVVGDLSCGFSLGYLP